MWLLCANRRWLKTFVPLRCYRKWVRNKGCDWLTDYCSLNASNHVSESGTFKDHRAVRRHPIADRCRISPLILSSPPVDGEALVTGLHPQKPSLSCMPSSIKSLLLVDKSTFNYLSTMFQIPTTHGGQGQASSTCAYVKQCFTIETERSAEIEDPISTQREIANKRVNSEDWESSSVLSPNGAGTTAFTTSRSMRLARGWAVRGRGDMKNKQKGRLFLTKLKIGQNRTVLGVKTEKVSRGQEGVRKDQNSNHCLD